MREWTNCAACIGHPLEVFFPESNNDDKWHAAIDICSQCPVTRECLALVIGLDDFSDRYGMFGGLTPSQRASLRDSMRRLPPYSKEATRG
jgi:hypothetical protein